ncbi:MAG: hypothetical protein A3F18_01795 [Legionellales bacterium RIFCSPHIGHO2_12_FULL_37_14]|nr:MAG: hypothetical protein A3F18_01795 [Legionellales bacterium RIFCSPHIGHO2_12_FULL_37_14]
MHTLKIPSSADDLAKILLDSYSDNLKMTLREYFRKKNFIDLAVLNNELEVYLSQFSDDSKDKFLSYAKSEGQFDEEFKDSIRTECNKSIIGNNKGLTTSFAASTIVAGFAAPIITVLLYGLITDIPFLAATASGFNLILPFLPFLAALGPVGGMLVASLLLMGMVALIVTVGIMIAHFSTASNISSMRIGNPFEPIATVADAPLDNQQANTTRLLSMSKLAEAKNDATSDAEVNPCDKPPVKVDPPPTDEARAVSPPPSRRLFSKPSSKDELEEFVDRSTNNTAKLA